MKVPTEIHLDLWHITCSLSASRAGVLFLRNRLHKSVEFFEESNSHPLSRFAIHFVLQGGLQRTDVGIITFGITYVNRELSTFRGGGDEH